MKIKDLPKNKSIYGVVFLHPDTGERCIWESQWNRGVWFKKDAGATNVFPITVQTIQDALEWEVVP